MVCGRYGIGPIYLPRRDGRLSWPRLPGNAPAGSRTRAIFRSLVRRPTTTLPSHPCDHCIVLIIIFPLPTVRSYNTASGSLLLSRPAVIFSRKINYKFLTLIFFKCSKYYWSCLRIDKRRAPGDVAVMVAVCRTASRGRYDSSSSPTGRNKEFLKWAKVLLTSSDKCTRLRNSLVRTDP